MKTSQFDDGRSLFDEPVTTTDAPVRPIDEYRAGLIDQIVWDTMTLAMDSIFHAPSREFYEQRIAEYRAELNRLDGYSV